MTDEQKKIKINKLLNYTIDIIHKFKSNLKETHPEIINEQINNKYKTQSNKNYKKISGII